MQLHAFTLSFLTALAVSMTESNVKSVNKTKQSLTPISIPPVNPVLIESLRQHYIALESDLWHLMDSGIDTAYILEQMHITHLRFFDEHFYLFNVTFNDFAVDRQNQLASIVDDIHGIETIVVKNSLRQNPSAFDENVSINAARHQLNLTHQIDTLFDITDTKEFYETIRNVSVYLHD